MKKNELIKEISKVSELTKKDVEKVLDVYSEVLRKGLLKGEEIPFVCGGKFIVKEAAERETLKNPKQPELGKKTVPAHKVVKFKTGKQLKELFK